MRRSLRSTGTALALGGLLTGGLFVSSTAHATPTPLTDPVRAGALATELGPDRTAGVYYDTSGRLVVAVTDQAAANAVRTAGGTAAVVAHSTTALTAIKDELDLLAGIPNSTWGVDPSSNQVSVEIHDSISAVDRAKIEAVAAEHPGAVQIDKLPGKLVRKADMRGGIGITSGSRICTAGFNVQNTSGSRFLLTAGHCVIGGYTSWNRYNGEVPLGVRTSYKYEPSDYAIIDYTNPDIAAFGTIMYDGADHQITSSRWVNDGESVKRVGTRSKDLVGAVLDPSVTVNYDDGANLENMIKTSLCSLGGDSGGPLFSGTTALGLLSGGTDETVCNSNVSDRRSYYQPVQAVLNTYHLSVY